MVVVYQWIINMDFHKLKYPEYEEIRSISKEELQPMKYKHLEMVLLFMFMFQFENTWRNIPIPSFS